MLAHFHFINKGVIPFSLPHNAAGKQELAKAANLTDEQVEFVWRTARLAHDPERGMSPVTTTLQLSWEVDGQ